MTEPKKASDVDVTSAKPDPELLRERARAAVGRRASRREAMDRLGLTGQGTSGLIESIEERSKRASEDRMAAFRERRAVEKAARQAVQDRIA